MDSAKKLVSELKVLKPMLAKDEASQERFNFEANQFYSLALHHRGFPFTKLKDCVDMFKTIFMAGLSWEPRAKQVSLLDSHEGGMSPFVHYQGQIKLASNKGVIERVTADLLYESDEFEFTGATEMPTLRRKLRKEGMGEAIGGYTISYLQSGGIHVELFDIEALQKAEEAGVMIGNGEFWRGPHRREMQRKALINATANRWLELSYTMKSINQTLN